MAQVHYFTAAGLQKLKDEIEYLTHVERPSISAQIAEARDKGDLSENAEYDAAKNAQGMLEMRISKLRDLIADARIIDQSNIDTSKVSIFTTVKLKNLKTNAVVSYTLVSEDAADLKTGKLSVASPISKGLLGKKKGDVVEITIPAGKLNFEVLDITVEV